MRGKKQVNFVFPEDLLEAAQAKANEENISVSELVRRGLKYILGVQDEEADMRSLKEELLKHEQQLVTVNQQLLSLAHKLEQLESRSMTHAG